MNDWYNANEHRSYPFIENRKASEPLAEKEIVDCKFFLINATDATVYLESKSEVVDEETNEVRLKYTFHTANGNIELTVPKTPDYKVVKFNEEGIGYGFVVFGDTTVQEENS